MPPKRKTTEKAPKPPKQPRKDNPPKKRKQPPRRTNTTVAPVVTSAPAPVVTTSPVVTTTPTPPVVVSSTTTTSTVVHSQPTTSTTPAVTSTTPISSVTTALSVPPAISSTTQTVPAAVSALALPPATLDLQRNALAAAILGNPGHSSLLNPAANSFLPAGQGLGLAASTTTPSIHLPLDSGVSAPLKEKIWADKYLDLRQLLPNQNITPQYTVSLTDVDAAPILTLANRQVQNKTPLTLDQWTDAFLVYHYIYIQRHPAATSALVSYQHLIRTMASRGANWLRYDEAFRSYRQSSTHTPWNSPHLQLYIDAFTTPFQVARPQPASQAVRPSASASRQSAAARPRDIPRSYCFPFHRQNGKCLRADCPFIHTCPYCRSAHKAYICPKRPVSNQN
ncbi:mucin-5AC-like [Branchiostoma floridae]|uniref:Mucin-5AC-like n=1 Tax=Branchiostoma floridae TaxID=7739 RepID=A0A9J7HS70_BRAFL|nr:mucin-5AC-like [Branchiostoma floridae]